MKRTFDSRQRKILALVSGNQCQKCGVPLKSNYHADHIRPFARGGPTILMNGQTLCPTCNLRKGATIE